jgi:mono/diheme cytochrome c family protein
MSDGDVKAIAVYLKSLPSGAAEPKVAPPSSAQMADGEKVYRGACIACHETDGSSAPRIYPPLPANANLQSSDPASTIRIILDGAESITTPRAPNTGSMPAYAAKLSDKEIADVTTYIRNAWGNVAPAVTVRKSPKARGK